MDSKRRPDPFEMSKRRVKLPQEKEGGGVPVMKVENGWAFKGLQERSDGRAEESVFGRVAHEGSFGRIVVIDGVAADVVMIDDKIRDPFARFLRRHLKNICGQLLTAERKRHAREQF